MSHELYFTSAPRGLRPGSNGYCTVAATYGLPGPLFQKLEALSDYRPLFDEADGGASRLPVALSHLRIHSQGKVWSVVSRICMAGMDHSRRRVFFAHHVALEAAELPPGGPAWLADQHGFLETSWDAQVRELPTGRRPVMGDCPPGACRAWAQATGDAGWAGHLAEEFQKNPNKPVYILYPLNLKPLPLLMEALALLPAEQRWQVTFSTLYRSLPQDVTCIWRCMPLEAPEANKVRALAGALVFDLGRAFGPADGGPLVEAARTGKLPRGASSTGKQSAEPPPMVGGGWRKQPAAAPAPAVPARKPEPEWVVEPEPEDELKEAVPAIRTRPAREVYPEARGLPWFVPFALGLVLGALLLSVGAAVGWRVLKDGHAKDLETQLVQARTRAQNELDAAVGRERQEAAREKKSAVEREREGHKQTVKKFEMNADLEREEAEKKARELAAAKARAEKKLKEMIPKSDLVKEVEARDQTLNMLATTLFDVHSKQADDLKSYLQNIQKGKEADLAKLSGLIEEWLKSELSSLEESSGDLRNLQQQLDLCTKAQSGGNADELLRRCQNGIESCDKLKKRTTSLLLHKRIERIRKDFTKRMP